MDGLYNATARIIKPISTPTGPEDLERQHDRDELRPTLRCSLRQMTRKQEATVLGDLATAAYVCRLRTAEVISVGWQLSILQDGDREWVTYYVREARRAGLGAAWNLLVEKEA